MAFTKLTYFMIVAKHAYIYKYFRIRLTIKLFAVILTGGDSFAE